MTQAPGEKTGTLLVAPLAPHIYIV
jgi:hypothetical protein